MGLVSKQKERKMKDTTKKDLHVKNGNRVLVIAGKDKGKTGNIRKVDRTKGKVIVEGLNMVTKAQKAQPALNIQGGLFPVTLKLILKQKKTKNFYFIIYLIV